MTAKHAVAEMLASFGDFHTARHGSTGVDKIPRNLYY